MKIGNDPVFSSLLRSGIHNKSVNVFAEKFIHRVFISYHLIHQDRLIRGILSKSSWSVLMNLHLQVIAVAAMMESPIPILCCHWSLPASSAISEGNPIIFNFGFAFNESTRFFAS